MAKDLNATGRWLKKIAQGFVGEPQDRTELVALLRQASQRGLVDADALSMLEGVLEVGDLQVRDIMIPRAQMDVIDISESPDKFIPLVIDTNHSRFPVIEGRKDNVIGILLAMVERQRTGERRGHVRVSPPGGDGRCRSG